MRMKILFNLHLFLENLFSRIFRIKKKKKKKKKKEIVDRVKNTLRKLQNNDL